MENSRYDEYQLKNRHRIAFQTMVLMMALIWINGFFKNSYGVWAPPLLEALVLLYIPGMYFAMGSIIKNAYMSKKDSPVFIHISFGLIFLFGLFSLVPFIIDGSFTFVENGQLSDRIGIVLLTTLFGGLLIALLIRKWIDKHRNGLED